MGVSWSCILPHMTGPENADLKSEVKDVSGIFDHYRMSARAIWNTAFWPDQDFRNWDSIEQFHEIEKLLFQELVLAKVDREWPSQNVFETAIPFFHIVPSHVQVHGVPILNSETTTGDTDRLLGRPGKLCQARGSGIAFHCVLRLG